MNVGEQVLVLFLLIIIGFAARKTKLIDDAAINHFSAFVLNLTLPALILASLQKPFSEELLGQAGVMLGLSFLIYALSFVLAAVYPTVLALPRVERGAHRYALIFSNVGFMGFPVVAAALGDDALFYLAIYNIPFNLLAFSVGAWLIARDGTRPLKLSGKMFMNLAFGATVVGFACFLVSAVFPPPLLRVLKMTGDITSPLSMIIIGAILARMDPRRLLGRWRVYLTVGVRLLALPGLVGLSLYWCGARGLFLALPTIVVGMPVAANTTILANVYGGDVETASALVFLSTLAAVATIPLIVFLLT